MSRIATDWAWRQKLKAPLKLVLLSLADRAGEHHECYPSIERLVQDTGLNRKTIISALDKIQELGLIVDTGARKGSTGRVKVYKIVSIVEQYQKRNHSENGTLNSPKNGTLNSTENGTQNQSLEPVIEPVTKNKVSKADVCDETLLKTWNDFAEENGLAKLRGITDQKKKIAIQCYNHYKKVKQQIGQTVQITTLAEFAEAYLAAVNGLMTDFHRGASGWKASYDFIFAKQVMENVITTNELRRK